MKISHEEFTARIENLKILLALQSSIFSIALATKAVEDDKVNSKIKATGELLDKMIDQLDKDSNDE